LQFCLGKAGQNLWNGRKYKYIGQNIANAGHWNERLSGRNNPEVFAGLVVKPISV